MTVTENSNSPEITENNEEGNAAPNFTLPDSWDSFVAKIPLSAESHAGNNPAVLVAQQLFIKLDEAKRIVAELAAANRDMDDSEIVEIASSRPEPEIRKLYKAQEIARKAYEDALSALVEKTKTVIGNESLTEEQITEKTEKKKELTSEVNSFKGSIDTLMFFMDKTEIDYFKFVISEIRVPGMRGKSSVRTSSGSGGSSKPRLNGGKIHVGNKEFSTFMDLVKHLSVESESNVDRESVIGAWCRANSADDWSDIPMGVSSFKFGANGKTFEIQVEKMPAVKKEKEKKEEAPVSETSETSEPVPAA